MQHCKSDLQSKNCIVNIACKTPDIETTKILAKRFVMLPIKYVGNNTGVLHGGCYGV